MNKPKESCSMPGKHIPERMCVICRKRLAKAELARHIMSAAGTFQADLRQNLPGRGWYLCADSTCVAKFAKFRPGKRNARKENGKGSQGAI